MGRESEQTHMPQAETGAEKQTAFPGRNFAAEKAAVERWKAEINARPDAARLTKRERLLLLDLKEYFEQRSPVTREYWLGDPTEFACMLGVKENGDARPREYEKLIPEVEKRCLGKIVLLERYKLALRGDCVVEETARDPKREFERRVTGAVRQNRFSLDTEEKKLRALGALLMEIIGCNNIARNYERRNFEQESLQDSPGIVYGFLPFGADVQAAETAHFEEYFHGHTDDIGDRFENVGFLRLPRSRAWPRGAGYQSDADRDFFPIMPPILLQKGDPRVRDLRVGRKRNDRFFSKTPGAARRDTFYDFQLVNAKTYFNALLFADKILSDIETNISGAWGIGIESNG